MIATSDCLHLSHPTKMEETQTAVSPLLHGAHQWAILMVDAVCGSSIFVG